MNKSIVIDPAELFLWTFRRNENDVVKLYNKLSGVMRLATGGNMLNFGYWTEETRDPIQAQTELCNVFGKLAELELAKKVVDVGSGLSAPSIQWKSQYNLLEITCLDINYNQLKSSLDTINQASENPNSLNEMHLLNATSTKLPIQSGSVDRVLALESAQHMKPLDDFITESKRILKKDGIFALAIPIVNKEIIPIIKLGILSLTWSSEHYDIDNVKSSLTKCGFDILEIKKIGSMVYKPLADYYIDNRDSIKKKILTKYPSYVEKILFKSLLKMKNISENNVIDYLLIKCKK